MLSSLSPPLSAPFLDIPLGVSDRGFFGSDPKLLMQHTSSLGSDRGMMQDQRQQPGAVVDGSRFQGKFENKFKDSYMRNHKAVNTKNLRCFPVCSENHRDNGFCGSEVVVTWQTAGRTSIGNFETYGEFQEAEDAPRFAEGDLVNESQLVNDEDDKNKRRYIMKGDTKMQDANHGSLHFARESKGWHYGWMAGRGNGTHTLHEMRVYLLERLSSDQLVCRLVLRSPSFEVTSRKRQRKKKDDKSDGEEEEIAVADRSKRVRREVPDGKKFATTRRDEQLQALPPMPPIPRAIPPPPTMGPAGMQVSSSSSYQRQQYVPSGSQGQGMHNDNQPRADGGGKQIPAFAQPNLPRSQQPRVPGFFYQSHTPQQSAPFMQPPSFGSLNNQRMPGQVQWPFGASPTPPSYAPFSTTPPTYLHPSTTPPTYLPMAGGYGSDIGMYLGGMPQPGVSDNEIYESLLAPTPPVHVPQQQHQMFRQHQAAAAAHHHHQQQQQQQHQQYVQQQQLQQLHHQQQQQQQPNGFKPGQQQAE